MKSENLSHVILLDVSCHLQTTTLFISIKTFALKHLNLEKNVTKKTTERVLLLYKKTTKIVFLWLNMGH